MTPGEQKEMYEKFEGSKIWCHRFKVRYGYKSRRHTTCHTLPIDFRTQATEFIADVHREPPRINNNEEDDFVEDVSTREGGENEEDMNFDDFVDDKSNREAGEDEEDFLQESEEEELIVG